MSAEQVTPLV